MNIFLKKPLGWLTIIILAALPIIRWLFLQPLNARFFDFSSIMASLGQVFGLLGMALFSLNLILASRLKFLDKYFYGLNRVYTYHRAVGSLAFSLLLFHPLFLAARYAAFSLREAALFLLPFTGDPAITFGIISLALMIILLAITFYAKIKYQHWKMSHKFMTLAFVFAILHVMFTQSDVSRDVILRVYVLTLAFIGLIAGSYRAWLNNFFNHDYEYKIINLYWLGQGILEVELAPVNRAMKFQAGQFAFLRVKGAELSRESHPFSMSSPPDEKNLRFLIKDLGDYTGELKKLRVGDRALVEGPFGKFYYQSIANKNQIWLAGGIGLAPFLGMARDLNDRDYKVDLYYSYKDKSEAVFLEELEKIAAAHGGFKIIPWLSAEQGRITGQRISELSRGLSGKDIFICGPAVFMKSLREQLMKLSAPAGNIHWEKFDLI